MKVFGQAFFKKLAGDERGRRPLLFCAARIAKQKKTVPAKNSEAIFWRPRFTRPLRAGERANANFACSEGFFCARCAAPADGAGRSCAGCRCCGGFRVWCPGFFLPVFRCLVPGLRAACCFCAWSGLRCLLLLLSLSCVAGACLPFAQLCSLVFLSFPA